ncbi:TetR/AcrR family transcriptional regulator [Cellulomonas aerilata]|uniref:TetR family transcriptional regulator n=1 Tax=Cellulomonas aerilata TaxID=515326 RepID=A0A512DG62_9CELL|nr:TetR/AcrR family transcriptional regulator [Cellulomonas aerilata]GEO35477.1 TetR family transcriptional regulator [Cellulomonas aerilata]
MARRPGRPRANAEQATGRGTAQDLLDAAAALFCTVGYTSTSTYAIAERAGVRQASMYHHFAGKHAILHELLLGTVRPSLRNAELLARIDAGVPARLWALAAADVELLCAPRDNLGALYFLPELSDERFAPFRALHLALRAGYADLVGQYPGVRGEDVGELSSLAIGLVESVILRRREEPDLRADDVAPRVADAVQRLLGATPAGLAAVRAEGLALRATLPDLGVARFPQNRAARPEN